jgi:hypothetical protein
MFGTFTTKTLLKSLTLGGLMLAATAAPALASQPEMAMQMRNTSTANGCIGELAKVGLMQYFRAELIASLRAGGENNPNPDVRTVPCANGKEIIGVWLKPAGSYGAGDTTTARIAALGSLNILSGSENFAVRTTKQALVRRVGEELDKNGRRLNTAGQPDPEGSIYLDSHSLDFWTGHVRTTINAHKEIPITWDFYFQVIQQDNLSLSNGQIQCTSDAPTVEDDSTWYDLFQLVTGNFLDVLTQVVLNDYGFRWLDRKIAANFGEGPGCALAAAIPTRVMLPGSYNDPFLGEYALKLAMNYSRLSINNDTGITAGGSYARVMRQPNVDIGIVGHNPIRSDSNVYTAKFRYWADDLRPPFQEVKFSATGPASVGSDGRITWTLASQPKPGDPPQSVSVKVTDADGISASAVMVVRFEFSLTPDLPPVCDQHPERFECREP